MARIAIIGGGVAGLTAAAELRGHSVILLEAKDVLGGRLQTVMTKAGPVELGAEFLHGKNPSLLRAVRRANLHTQKVSAHNQMLQDGRLESIDIWGRFGELVEKIDPKAPDQSFLKFIKAQSLENRTERMMLAFAEGFNAAHAGRISAHSLKRADYSAAQIEGETQLRIESGYSGLVAHFVEQACTAGAEIKTGVAVHEIEWRPGQVRVHTSNGPFHADAAIITLPLGVLKTGSVTFNPALPDKMEAIRDLAFGNVVRISLIYHDAWWGDSDFGFVHALDKPIPTWWCRPGQPILTGWAGGPKADALAGLTRHELERMAMEILPRVFPGALPTGLLASYYHDWADDPHARGAYSYIPVNGLFLPKQLAVPVESTLFFAGEATALDAQMGTVFGALESGLRAAREANASV